ncbi:MAG: DNA translocase FtsK 4TM domain-containing protein [Candidatus Dadabacteria bacterium]|nr:DNA translocase FtsK 4TM domain-containing protein [Candidatus Dadabacteria bacterium]
MSNKKGGFKKEAAAVGVFLLGAITAAGLVAGGSLSPFGGGAVGWVGKTVSGALSSAFGVASLLIPAGCAYLCVRLVFFNVKGKALLKDAAAAVGLLASTALLSGLALEGVLVNHLTQDGAGGKLGREILRFTVDTVGVFGSYVVGLSVVSVCLVFLARTSLRTVLSSGFNAVAKTLSVSLKAVVSVLLRLSEMLRSAAVFAAGLVKKFRAKTPPSPPVIKEEKQPAPVASSGEEKAAEAPKLVVKKQDKKNLKPAGKDPAPRPEGRSFALPPINLLEKPEGGKTEIDKESAYGSARLIEEKLQSFGVSGKVTEIRPGPVITMFEYKPASGVKVSKIASLEDDLAMNLSASSIRIISPIPGRDVVGIEVPNNRREKVCLREIIENPEFAANKSLLTIAVGKDISGAPYYTDLAAAPHLMIAGTTGSGKSVLLNSLLASLFYKTGPDRLRLLMIDPKMLEFAIYEDIPHLLHPIVTEPRKAIAALKWAVAEMEGRYKILSQKGVRNIDSYNSAIERDEGPGSPQIMPYIVILIDELADLIMSAAGDTRDCIIRIAQKARAAGIHLVVATQRPSADVVSGLLKANIPARISFLVSSKVDSRIILDAQGAESLLGKGDMLYLKPGTGALERIQGALITDEERERIVDFLKSQGEPAFDSAVADAINKPEGEQGDSGTEERDEMYEQALEIVTEAGQVSISMLQRRLKIGYNRAATIVEQMEREGIVGEPQGAGKPREVISPGEGG